MQEKNDDPNQNKDLKSQVQKREPNIPIQSMNMRNVTLHRDWAAKNLRW